MIEVAETIDPNPADLIESLRDFGYTLPTAIADLLDNSITAGAREVRIDLDPGPRDPHIAVVDDGAGMSLDQLVQAMKLGTSGPLRARCKADLGRFGLGLKTASLSMGKCLTVITKQAGEQQPTIRRWDVRHIRESGKWSLLAEATPVALSYLSKVRARARGTAVIIEDLDRIQFVGQTGLARDEHLAAALNDLRERTAMVFHRFIEEGLVIRLGDTPVPAWDPFLRSRSTRLPTESILCRESRIEVTPFILPHSSKLSHQEFEGATGVNGWNAHQGFYVYRCKRLIVPGTWLGLRLRKEEHFKLARIQVDLPNSLDADWKLNVMKSHVEAPPTLRDEFSRIAKAVRREASNVYRHRGERVVAADGEPPRGLWRRFDAHRRTRFRIDRQHPLLFALLNEGDARSKLFADALSLIEQTIPIDSILQVPSKSLEGSVLPEDGVTLDGLVDLARAVVRYHVRAGIDPVEARRRVLAVEPLVRVRAEIEARLDSEVLGQDGGSAS